MSGEATRRGFQLRCPFCGEEDSIQMDVHNLGIVECAACETEIDRTEIEEILIRWLKFWDWVVTAPPYPGD